MAAKEWTDIVVAGYRKNKNSGNSRGLGLGPGGVLEQDAQARVSVLSTKL